MATLDHILEGRLTLNVISSDFPGQQEDSAYRYRRSWEVVEILKQAWTQDEINYEGQIYNIKGLPTDPVRPYQTGGPLLYFGGYSPDALALCGAHCDTYLMWPEPKEVLAQRMRDVHAQAEKHGRLLDYGLRVHMIVRDTEAEAREYARELVSKLDDEKGREIRARALDAGSLGVSTQARRREMADIEGYVEPHLWTGVGRARSGCGAALVGSVDQVLSENDIAYIKWDHNRVLVDTGHLGQAGVHRQTQAIYRLFAELKKRHAGLEIESCASGGARIDLGVIDLVDRFWTSDNNDALERQTIQRWTAQVIPPELLGTHIGPTHGHQTGRTLELSMRATTALFGHAGIEWNITEATEQERKHLATWAKYYKENRGLLHTGKMVRVDYPEAHAYLHGVTAHDQSRAIFAYVQLTPTVAIHPSPLKFPGLDQSAMYTIKAVFPAGKPRFMLITPPEWMSGITLSGSALASIGVTAPILAPANAFLIEITKA